MDRGIFKKLCVLTGGVLSVLVVVLVNRASPSAVEAAEAEKPTIAVVFSYTDVYEWQQQIRTGIEQEIAGRADLKFHDLDTLGVSDTDEVAARGQQAIEWLRGVEPDAIIVADDKAMRYVADAGADALGVPLVFCGVNWPASNYDLPRDGVSGMVEVSPSRRLLEVMSESLGARAKVVLLGADRKTDRVQAKGFVLDAEALGLRAEAVLVSTFEEWKDRFVELQVDSDLVYVVNNAGISGWDDVEAKALAERETRTLTATEYAWMKPYVLVGALKRGEEQGAWAGGEAWLRIVMPNASQGPIMVNDQTAFSLNTDLDTQLIDRVPAYLQILAKEQR